LLNYTLCIPFYAFSSLYATIIGQEMYHELLNCYMAVARQFRYVLLVCSDAIEPLYSYKGQPGLPFEKGDKENIEKGLLEKRKPFQYGFFFSCRVC
jgi:hypothetical protein